jgi:hypothetical protein
VGEADDPGIKSLEGINPVWDAGQGLIVRVTMGLPRELVGGVLGGRVVALPRHDHRSIGPADDQ